MAGTSIEIGFLGSMNSMGGIDNSGSAGIGELRFALASIPEPTSLLMFGLAVVPLSLRRRR